MAALSGHNVAIYAGGTPTTMTAEACAVVTGNTYRITDADRRIIDPETAVLVYENAVLTVQSYVVNYLEGTITFAGAATTPVTITGKFVPRGRVLCAKSAEVNEERATFDSTCFKLAGEANEGSMRKFLGIKDASGTLSHIEPITDQIDTSGAGTGVDALLVEALLRNALDYTILEIQFGVSVVFRAFVVFTSVSKSVSVDDLVNETLNWELASNGNGYYTEFTYVA